MKSAITLDGLRVLDAIARRGTFAAAAAELHRAPSSITYAIQQLEDRLATPLFDRRSHRAVMTAAGEALLREGRDLLAIAEETERNIRRIASGWESELRIAIGDLVTDEATIDLCGRLGRVSPGTRLRISTEVLSGIWDALLSNRADLIIGAAGDAPPGGGFHVEPIGEVEFVFVVTPDHPLAALPEPIPIEMIRSCRAIAAADSSRQLPTKTFGLLPGQDVLTLPDIRLKKAAQLHGLGVGHLPRHLIHQELTEGRLVARTTELGISRRHRLYAAWRTRQQGRLLDWVREQMLAGKLDIDWFGPP